MNKLGYKVNWTDNRKYITFTNPEGKKCRNRKLYPPENFTKEALLKSFELNNKRADEKELKDRMELILSAICLFKISPHSEHIRNYPLSGIEGESLKDEIAEIKKGKGLDWDKETGREM